MTKLIIASCHRALLPHNEVQYYHFMRERRATLHAGQSPDEMWGQRTSPKVPDAGDGQTSSITLLTLHREPAQPQNRSQPLGLTLTPARAAHHGPVRANTRGCSLPPQESKL